MYTRTAGGQRSVRAHDQCGCGYFLIQVFVKPVFVTEEVHHNDVSWRCSVENKKDLETGERGDKEKTY